VLAVEAEGKAILTIEGLRTSSSELHPIQQAFIDKDALQCGFCTPGQIMNAKALLEFNPNPTEAEVRNWMSGVLCRCGSYQNMREAVLAAASM
jgi:carbon-monoxide dehydrogenase small subunit